MRLQKSLIDLCRHLQSHSIDPILVGGAVRDYLLGRKSTDIDIECYNATSLDQLKTLLKPLTPVNEVGKQFGVLKCRLGSLNIDISLPRTEEKTGNSHRDFHVTTTSQLDFETASKRRDFTINAIGYDPKNDKFLDPHNGRNDLKNKILRHVGSQFDEDPLRVFRAMQFAGRFELEIHPTTLALCAQIDLHHISKERIWEEFKKCLIKSHQPSFGLRYITQLGIEQFLEIDLSSNQTQFKQILTACDTIAAQKLSPNTTLALTLSALSYHPTPQTRFEHHQKIADKVIPSKTIQTNSLNLLREMDRFLKPMTTPELKRLSTHVSIANLDSLCGALYPSNELVQKNAINAKNLSIYNHPYEALVKGRDLIKMGVPNGRKMGEFLKALFDAQIDGKFSDLETGLNFFKTQWKKK